MEERDFVSRAHSRRVRDRPRQLCRVALSDADRDRCTARLEESRGEAVRGRRPDHRSLGVARGRQRRGRACRPRRQVRRHAEPDCRLHIQHRFRAGRSRRATGEPDALQPLLSREARVLPGKPGHLQFRRLGHRCGEHSGRRYAAAVLQPPDRPQPGPGSTGAGRRPSHGTGRPLQHRRHRHRDPGCSQGACGPHQFFRVASAPRHPAPQQRRGDGHEAFGGAERPRLE